MQCASRHHHKARINLCIRKPGQSPSCSVRWGHGSVPKRGWDGAWDTCKWDLWSRGCSWREHSMAWTWSSCPQSPPSSEPESSVFGLRASASSSSRIELVPRANVPGLELEVVFCFFWDNLSVHFWWACKVFQQCKKPNAFFSSDLYTPNAWTICASMYMS